MKPHMLFHVVERGPTDVTKVTGEQESARNTCPANGTVIGGHEVVGHEVASPGAGRRRSRSKPRAWRHGSALIEFAALLPLLVALVLGCIDFGRFAYVMISVTNAAREGASYGAMHAYNSSETKALWEESVRETILDDLRWLPGFEEENLIVAPAVITYDDAGRRVRVVVGYRFHTVVPWPMVEDEVLLSQAVEMRSVR